MWDLEGYVYTPRACPLLYVHGGSRCRLQTTCRRHQPRVVIQEESVEEGRALEVEDVVPRGVRTSRRTSRDERCESSNNVEYPSFEVCSPVARERSAVMFTSASASIHRRWYREKSEGSFGR